MNPSQETCHMLSDITFRWESVLCDISWYHCAITVLLYQKQAVERQPVFLWAKNLRICFEHAAEDQNHFGICLKYEYIEKSRRSNIYENQKSNFHVDGGIDGHCH